MMRDWIKYFFAGAALVAVVVGVALPLRADSTNGVAAPPVTLGPSPVQVFRELLVMTPEERAGALTIRPPGMREPIEAKVKAYLALAPDERELRLQATELRHYLLLLMPLPATDRARLIPQIPESVRPAVAARMETWQIMPPSMQEEVLANEQLVHSLSQLGALSAAQRNKMLAAMPAGQRAKLEADIARWKTLAETTRKGVFAQLSQFFDLTPGEREKAVSKLSDAERDAMKQTVEAFSELTPEQRRTCIRSFEKFAGMSRMEREQFLKKAEAWQRMTPSEREQWREVVAQVPQLPPFPVGMVPHVGPVPPSAPPKTNPAMPVRATNGG